MSRDGEIPQDNSLEWQEGKKYHPWTSKKVEKPNSGNQHAESQRKTTTNVQMCI